MARSSARIANGETTDSETFQDNVTNTISQVLHSLYSEGIPEHFTRAERIQILSLLQEKKVFLVKGAIHRIADILNCSVPTVYRELARLKAPTKFP
ncbi:helix-turn-helix domain-containing protein [Muricomes intestini]|uniref:helix-turn-helix domain-containing protein n=1 Tax=Muricomes intestini TaxID=1796634 RepID=UPI002FE38EC2